ncbi:MAG: S-methyl-5'-thioadenosine phosphorylase [Deltaproteobacteria bacterium]|nr:S-methyl-5'-thioadenosine phosphorylase [Deltaproteobacteria bacterium]
MAGRIGVIGGSGLYDMPGLADVREERVSTPFGEPSDAFVLGTLEGQALAFLPRHGRGHRILPSELNFRANLYAMKALGVERVISVSAVGSMREGVRPGEIVVPDQFVDRTRHRIDTFFGRGIVAHVSFADPVCALLSAGLVEAGRRVGARMHAGGTYLCIEGPQFSTRAESRLYRQWGVEVIGMTNLQEAKLAREAELCYATLALVTDYDCWHDGEEEVTVGGVLEILNRNVATAQAIIREAVRAMPPRTCPCGSALKDALITDRRAITPEARRDVELLIGKYL